MCGIFGYVGHQSNAADIVLAGLKRLEYRGYDSWGIAAVPDTGTRIAVKKKAGKIGIATVNNLPKSTLAFGHTRWATHGGVSDINAHPHLDCSGTIALIHNGIFENYEGIKKRLIARGHLFRSETDTEVAVHLIEEYAKSMIFTKAVQKAFNDMKGLNAIIVIDVKDHTLVAARNGSPLVVGFGDGENFLASDAAALLPHTKEVHFLEDDEMAIIGANAIQLFNVKTGEHLHPKKQRLTWSVRDAEKGDYPFFMLKEIYEQPGVVSDIAANAAYVQTHAAQIKKSPGAYLVGCGTASYAAVAGEYLFSKIANLHVNVAIGSEFGYHLDFLNRDSLVVAISQSGETMDILESVKKARQKGAKILALVNVVGSTLYREADYTLMIDAGPEKGVASTKAFIGMLAHLTLLAYAVAGKTSEGVAVLTRAVLSMKKVLSGPSVKKIKELARKLKKTQHIYVIGRGLSYPTALETRSLGACHARDSVYRLPPQRRNVRGKPGWSHGNESARRIYYRHLTQTARSV
jgi:glucosamine--fructose-6-phosphate aminotransferase (isomerizing)